LPDLVVSAAEIAVTVTDWTALVAAGGLKVTLVVVVFDSVPAELVQVTPLLVESWVTVAVRVTELVPTPSTLVADAWMLTPMAAGPLEPPQAVIRRRRIASEETPRTGRTFRSMSTSDVLLYSGNK